METLYDLCATAEKPNRIEIAEILREMGRFDEAIVMLESVEVDGNNKATVIAEAARQKDPVVREVWRSQYDF